MTEVGCSWGGTRDLRTLIYLLNLKLREDCSRTLGWKIQLGLQAVVGSSSRSGRNRPGAAAEADASGEHAAAAEARAQSGSSSSAQRAVRRRITHGRRTRGK